jgi:hypothetical protein
MDTLKPTNEDKSVKDKPANGKASLSTRFLVGSLKMNTTLEYSTRVVQEGDRRCKNSTLNDLAYLTPLRIPLMNPVPVTHKCCILTDLLY